MAIKNPIKTSLPGSVGLPLIGETLSYINDPFGFLEKGVQNHGNIFKTNLLGRKTVVISGPESCEILLDRKLIKRENSMPAHIQELFGGKSLPLLDDEPHRNRKLAVMEAFNTHTIETYLPEIQKIIEKYFDNWQKKENFNFVSAAKQLSIEIICSNIFGLKDKSIIFDLVYNYQSLTKGFSSLPLNISGSSFNKAVKARERIFAIFDKIISQHHEKSFNDGLSRILNYRSDFGVMTDEQVKLEMHHIVIAGYIVFSELVAILTAINNASEVRTRLDAEINQKVPFGEQITAKMLAEMPYLNQVIMEVKRLCPVIPNVFSIAKEDFVFNNFTVTKGTTVVWALRSTNIDKNTYTDRLKFDPDRFSDERQEHKKHKYAYVPQGAGEEMDHRCAGLNYTNYIMSVFTIIF